MKKILSSFLIILILWGCNGAAMYRGHRVYLKDKDAVYSEFDMSIFRGIFPDMSYKEMIGVAGEPNDFYDYPADGFFEDREDEEYNPLYYGQEGKIEVAWSRHYSKNDEIGLVTYTPYNNVTYKLKDFVHNPSKLGIEETEEDFAVYVDDVQYFKVYMEEGKITKINFWFVKEKYFI